MKDDFDDMFPDLIYMAWVNFNNWGNLYTFMICYVDVPAYYSGGSL